MTDRYRLILADDHALIRDGLKNILAQRNDLEVVAEARNGLELMSRIREVNPHLILLDISMPILRGLEALAEIKNGHPDVKILVLTMHKDTDYLIQAISAGADGYLLKDDAVQDLFLAIDTVLKGKVYVSRFLAEESRQDWADLLRGARDARAADPLTVRERQILKLLAEGKSRKEIGDLLCISARTVEGHRARMMEKLRIEKTTDLIKYALQKGYI